MQYEEGQTFKTNRPTKFFEGYEDLETGASFSIKTVTEKVEYPYLVHFSNGYEIVLTEQEIEELTVTKENNLQEK